MHHVLVHSPEQAREIIAEAGRIADDSGMQDERWDRVFEQACALLGARFSFPVMPQPPPLDLGALGLNHKRRG